MCDGVAHWLGWIFFALMFLTAVIFLCAWGVEIAVFKLMAVIEQEAK
jgi:hypothetical protein